MTPDFKIGCSYFANRMVRHVAEDMKMLARDGFNYVMHTMCEYDLTFHRGNLRDIVSVSHDAGHEVWIDPWGVGNVFGGEPFSNFAAQNLYEACQVLDDDRLVPLACPNAPLFKDYLEKWIEAAAETGADLAFWDEPHFHDPGFLGGIKGRWGCRCRFCKSKFEDRYNKSMPKDETDEVKELKIASLRELIVFLLETSTKAGLKNALCIPPGEKGEDPYERLSQYSCMPALDVLSTDPYWMWRDEPVEIVGDYSRALKKVCDECGLEGQIWIQACKIPAGREEEIARAVELAAESGIRNLAAWSFEATAHESWITCENPEKAWRITVDALNRAFNIPK